MKLITLIQAAALLLLAVAGAYASAHSEVETCKNSVEIKCEV